MGWRRDGRATLLPQKAVTWRPLPHKILHMQSQTNLFHKKSTTGRTCPPDWENQEPPAQAFERKMPEEGQTVVGGQAREKYEVEGGDAR